jgi:hypothetical protein
MAERVRQVAGRMDLRSNLGNGTEIDVRFSLRASCSGLARMPGSAQFG